MNVKEAVKVLTEELVKDPSFRIGWQANIAVSFQDVFAELHKNNSVHKISNVAASRFLDLLCRDVKPLEEVEEIT